MKEFAVAGRPKPGYEKALYTLLLWSAVEAILITLFHERRQWDLSSILTPLLAAACYTLLSGNDAVGIRLSENTLEYQYLNFWGQTRCRQFAISNLSCDYRPAPPSFFKAAGMQLTLSDTHRRGLILRSHEYRRFTESQLDAIRYALGIPLKVI